MDSLLESARAKLNEWKQLAREGHPEQREPLNAAETWFDSSLTCPFMTAEQAHLGYEIYSWQQGRRPKSLNLMDRYLTQDLNEDERAWAWWNKVDMMACMSYGRGMDGVTATVIEHRAFYEWAKGNLSPDRLLWVIQDGSQAVCWREAGFAAEWFERFDLALSRAHVCTDNRWDRFIALRTAATVARVLRDSERSIQYIAAIHGLIDEDDGYSKKLDLMIEALTLDLLEACDQHDQARIDRIANEAISQLDAYESEEAQRRQELAYATGNFAAALLQAKAYRASAMFGKKSIELAPYNEHVFLRLAAALHATGAPKSDVLALLRRGAAFYHCGTYDIREFPEFADVRDDVDYLEAQSPQGSVI